MSTHSNVREAGVIEWALARPRNQAVYQDVTDLATLAAAYAYGLTRGHGYVDGNKHVGFVAMAIFLDLNGWSLEAPDPEGFRLCSRSPAASWRRQTWMRGCACGWVDAGRGLRFWDEEMPAPELNSSLTDRGIGFDARLTQHYNDHGFM